MIHHRLIRIGNSVGITLPKKFLKASKMQIGDTIVFEMNAEHKMLFIKPVRQTYNVFLRPDFFKWIKNNFIKRL